MNFPASKIMEYMQKEKTKKVIAVSKQNLLKFKSLFVEREKKIILVFNCPIDVDMENGRENDDLCCLRDMQWLQSWHILSHD